MIKNILYFGNKLAGHGINPTTIDLLGVILQQDFNVVSCSDKLNKCYRLFDMIKTFFIHRKKVDIILIDTYSTSNFWYALIIAKLAQLFKIPYIPILHGGGLPKRLKKNRRLCKDLFGHSVVNVSPSVVFFNKNIEVVIFYNIHSVKLFDGFFYFFACRVALIYPFDINSFPLKI